MATLVSPGTSISVIDQSINIGAGPGTVPLLFIATQENKSDPTGTSVAPGTVKATAGTVYSITSQRDLVQTFGDPIFYNISGTSLNGYPLNEYGLLAAYSYLGSSNLCRVVRADIDTAQLEATPIEPTSPASAGTYWLDETASSFGLFTRVGATVVASYGYATTVTGGTWVATAPKFIYNLDSASVPPSSDGVQGDYAVVFRSSTSTISYWLNGGYTGWAQIAGTDMIMQDVWPNLDATTAMHWVKTTAAARGANIVLRRMDATLGQWTQVEDPIVSNDVAADLYYSTNTRKSAGQICIEPTTNEFVFKYSAAAANSWVPFAGIVGSLTAPVNGPANGRMWFNALVGLDNEGLSTIDLLVANGAGGWDNINLPGFTGMTVNAGQPTLHTQSSDPRDNVPAVVLAQGDIWVDTDVSPYPVIKRWSSTAWVLVDTADQVTPNGIIFQDARPNPMFNNTSATGVNNGGGTNPDLDPDAPDSDLYPKGFLLWNTRYSTNNVKQWQSPYVHNDVESLADARGSKGRWVTLSGNNPGGKPYMGANAQQIVIVRAIQSVITDNEAIRAEDMYFNIIAAPGYVEAIDEMLVLNEDRKNTAFVVGDTPFTLSPTGTALQKWSSNSAVAYGNGTDGLVSSSKYFATWYPSGLSTNVDGTDVVVPPSHMALRSIAYNDQVSYPWFAPAGLQRGIVNNASSVGYVNASGQYIPTKLSEGQRDILYVNGINPIRTMPAGGIVLFGQKTRQPYSSATDRINVVRLENYLRYQLNALAQPFLFEPNDSTTRKAVKDSFDRALSELITLRGLYDFLVVCDLSNNTPARIDRNELWIDIAIQPVKAIEFIYIPIRIKNTGDSLSM